MGHDKRSSRLFDKYRLTKLLVQIQVALVRLTQQGMKVWTLPSLPRPDPPTFSQANPPIGLPSVAPIYILFLPPQPTVLAALSQHFLVILP